LPPYIVGEELIALVEEQDAKLLLLCAGTIDFGEQA
jgi:hypothetical protein